MRHERRRGPHLQDEVDEALAGLQQQLVEAHAKPLPLQRVPHRVTNAQLVAHVVQTPLPSNTHTQTNKQTNNQPTHN